MIYQADVNALVGLIKKVEEAAAKDCKTPEALRDLIVANTMMDALTGRFAVEEVDPNLDLSELQVWLGRVVARTRMN